MASRSAADERWESRRVGANCYARTTNATVVAQNCSCCIGVDDEDTTEEEVRRVADNRLNRSKEATLGGRGKTNRKKEKEARSRINAFWSVVGHSRSPSVVGINCNDANECPRPQS